MTTDSSSSDTEAVSTASYEYRNHPAVADEPTKPLSDIVDVAVPDDAGLTLTAQGADSAALTLTGHEPVTVLWKNLVKTGEIQHHFIVAARNAVATRGRNEFDLVLDAMGISDTPAMGHDPREMVHRLRDRPAVAKKKASILLDIIQELGSGVSKIDDVLAMAKLFQFAYEDNLDGVTDVETPVVNVEAEYAAFKSLDREQRSNVCRLLCTLSKALDVRFVTSRETQAFLRNSHREELPDVSEWETTYSHRARVDEAIARFDPEGTSVAILRTAQSKPDGTLPYHELYENFSVSDSRVRQCINLLDEYGLVERFGSPQSKKITLLEAGREVVDSVTEEFEFSGSQTPNSQRQRREGDAHKDSPGWRRPGAAVHSNRTAPHADSESDGQAGSNHSTAEMSVARRDAIAACGYALGSVTIVNDGVEEVDSSAQFVSVDTVREKVVVSTHATNPLDYTVGIAVALAHPKLIEQALDEQALATVLDDVPEGVLRRARQVGYLTDEVLADAGKVQEMLLQWREDIEELTRRLRRCQYGNGEYEDRSDLLSQIVRDSHGLTGSVVHLLDAVGVDVIRDIRVPDSLNSAKIEALAESITHSVAIQSQYKEFNAHRQLFESRPEYRARAPTVEVDTADPGGTLIGSMVIRGGSAVRLEPVLKRTLAELEPHEDAPEFCVPVTMRGVTRENVAVTASRVLARKNRRITKTAVSVLDAIVDSPVHVAEALEQLDDNPELRDIESVELRQALRRLSADDMLSGLSRSVGKIVSVLIEAREPISQSELTDRAEITGQTVRNHADALLNTGLVQCEEKASGAKEWRVALSFGRESDQDVFPTACTESLESVVDVTGDCNCAERTPAGAYSADFVGLTGSCLLSEREQVAAALTNSSELCERTTEVMLGPEVGQTSIHDVFQADGVEEPFGGNHEMERRDAEDVSRDGHKSDDGDGDGEQHSDEIDLSGVSIAGADDRYKPDHPDSGEGGS